jgi:hypothetical protein
MSLYIGLAVFYPVVSRVLRIGYEYNGITVEVYGTTWKILAFFASKSSNTSRQKTTTFISFLVSRQSSFLGKIAVLCMSHNCRFDDNFHTSAHTVWYRIFFLCLSYMLAYIISPFVSLQWLIVHFYDIIPEWWQLAIIRSLAYHIVCQHFLYDLHFLLRPLTVYFLRRSVSFFKVCLFTL